MGKVGRFFIVGPREFGVHPSTNALRYMNDFMVFAIGEALVIPPILK
jgi:hypothetical protein